MLINYLEPAEINGDIPIIFGVYVTAVEYW